MSRLPQAEVWGGVCIPSGAEDSRFGPIFYSKGTNERPHKGNVYPCEKMLYSKLSFGKNMQKKTTSLTTIPVFRGKIQTKYMITQDQPS